MNKMLKVYCKQCKHYLYYIEFHRKYGRGIPVNSRINKSSTVPYENLCECSVNVNFIDDPLYRNKIKSITVDRCEDKNRNNDCPDFEKRLKLLSKLKAYL